MAYHQFTLKPLLGLALIAVLLSSQTASVAPVRAMSPVVTPASDFFSTLGDFFSLGHNTVKEARAAIADAHNAANNTIDKALENADKLLNDAQAKYKDMLDVTISELDQTAQDEINRLVAAFDRINSAIQDDIRLLIESTRQAISDAVQEISQAMSRLAAELERRLQNTILFADAGIIYLFDRATYDILGIVGIVALLFGFAGLGGLFIARAATTGLQSLIGWSFVAAWLVLSVGITFWPPSRFYIMRWTGAGLQQSITAQVAHPRALRVFPTTVTLGVTRDLQVWGDYLNYQEITPTVTLANSPVSLKDRPLEDALILDVSSLSVPEGEQTLRLVYTTGVSTGQVVSVRLPTPVPTPVLLADLIITGFTVDPAPPVTGIPVKGLNAIAHITVKNVGQGMARGFHVRWRPDANLTVGPEIAVDQGLAPNASATVNIEGRFEQAGTPSSAAVADSDSEVQEGDENNNADIRRFNVAERTKTLIVSIEWVGHPGSRLPTGQDIQVIVHAEDAQTHELVGGTVSVIYSAPNTVGSTDHLSTNTPVTYKFRTTTQTSCPPPPFRPNECSTTRYCPSGRVGASSYPDIDLDLRLNTVCGCISGC